MRRNALRLLAPYKYALLVIDYAKPALSHHIKR